MAVVASRWGDELMSGGSDVDESGEGRPILLIVEDDPDLAAVLEAILDPEFDVVVARDGVEGLAALERTDVDLVVSDVMMPNMDGADMLSHIRSNPDLDGMPVIILTAVLDSKLRVKLLEAGATDFMSKPFSVPELLARVRNVRDAALLRRRLQANLVRRTAELNQLNRELVELTEHDPLTGLPNRTRLLEFLDAPSAHPENRQAGLILIKVDDLERVNAAMGFAAVDAGLIEIANRWSGVTGRDELLVRLDGSKFALAIRGRRAGPELTAIAQRMLLALSSQIVIGADTLIITGSAGVASGIDATAEALLRNADLAMRRASAEGRGRVAVFEEELHRAAAGRLGMEQALRGALAKSQFQLHYQPEFLLDGGATRGLEALIRWSPEPGRMVSPGEFLPVAKAAGLMEELDVWVLRTACRESRRWSESLSRAGGRVWVNMSAQTLLRPDLAELVIGAIEAESAKPSLIGIEIIETVAMDVALPGRHFDELVDLGVQLAIDDFGTGYSSLARLRELPISVLKLDISLIREVATDASAALVVRAAIEMGHAMGLRVLAEGIETEEQRQRLIDLECDLGQGYLLARPSPPDAITLT